MDMMLDPIVDIKRMKAKKKDDGEFPTSYNTPRRDGEQAHIHFLARAKMRRWPLLS